MPFLHQEDELKELTYEDVFLLPQASAISSRMDVDISPSEGIGTTMPVVVANMSAVAGRRMAETVTRRGGLVILPQDMPLSKVKEVVDYLQSCHLIFETPVVLEETESIQTALNLIHKRAHGAIIVINEENRPVGIFTEKDAEDRDNFSQLKEVMSKEIISMDDGAQPEQVFEELHRRRIPVMPLIKKSGELVGVLTAKGALRATIYKPALNKKGQLLSAAAEEIGDNSGRKQD